MTHLLHEFGVTNEMDQELQHLLISRTEGEALEVSVVEHGREVKSKNHARFRLYLGVASILLGCATLLQSTKQKSARAQPVATHH